MSAFSNFHSFGTTPRSRRPPWSLHVAPAAGCDDAATSTSAEAPSVVLIAQACESRGRPKTHHLNVINLTQSTPCTHPTGTRPPSPPGARLQGPGPAATGAATGGDAPSTARLLGYRLQPRPSVLLGGRRGVVRRRAHLRHRRRAQRQPTAAAASNPRAEHPPACCARGRVPPAGREPCGRARVAWRRWQCGAAGAAGAALLGPLCPPRRAAAAEVGGWERERDRGWWCRAILSIYSTRMPCPHMTFACLSTTDQRTHDPPPEKKQRARDAGGGGVVAGDGPARLAPPRLHRHGLRARLGPPRRRGRIAPGR